MFSNSSKPGWRKIQMIKWILGKHLSTKHNLMESAKSMAILITDNKKIVFSKMKLLNSKSKKVWFWIDKI